jgi:hypothetical protein
MGAFEAKMDVVDELEEEKEDEEDEEDGEDEEDEEDEKEDDKREGNGADTFVLASSASASATRSPSKKS